MKLIEEENGSGQRRLKKKIASKEFKNKREKIITAVKVSVFIYT